MRTQSLHDKRRMVIAWEVVNNKKKRNQWEGWLHRVALDYCFMAPLVVLLDEENFVSRSVTRTSTDRYDLCTASYPQSVSERESETCRLRYLVQNTG
jgi:hypothetical protein